MKIDIEKLICFLISDEVIENNIPESLKLGLKEQGYKYEDGKICPLQEEPVSEELEKAANNAVIALVPSFGQKYSDGSYVSSCRDCFKREELLELFKAGAQWQKLQDMGITNKAQDVVDDVLSSADSPLDAYATEVAFMMLPATLKESYHQTNRDRISDAVRLGAKWQKAKDQSTIELAEDHAMLAGMEKMKKEMIMDAIDVTVHIDSGGYPYIPQIEFYDYDNDVPLAKEGDKYKVVLIKEE